MDDRGGYVTTPVANSSPLVRNSVTGVTNVTGGTKSPSGGGEAPGRSGPRLGRLGFTIFRRLGGPGHLAHILQRRRHHLLRGRRGSKLWSTWMFLHMPREPRSEMAAREGATTPRRKDLYRSGRGPVPVGETVGGCVHAPTYRAATTRPVRTAWRVTKRPLVPLPRLPLVERPRHARCVRRVAS